MERAEKFWCELCVGTEWCGRACAKDPKKSNALLFHRDGGVKTLRERRLGWEDAPLVKADEVRKRAPAVLRKLVTKTPLRKPLAVTETAAVTKTSKGGRPRTGAVSAAERMRRMRERRKDEKGD